MNKEKEIKMGSLVEYRLLDIAGSRYGIVIKKSGRGSAPLKVIWTDGHEDWYIPSVLEVLA